MPQIAGPCPHAIQMPTLPLSPHTPAQQANKQFRQDNAYKYFGYPDFCKFMASDNDFFLLRRFGELNSRVLLKMQFEIMKLEKALNSLDQEIMNDPDPDKRNDSFAWDFFWDPTNNCGKSGFERKRILDQLQMQLKEYSE
jgi:hypothetical protein